MAMPQPGNGRIQFLLTLKTPAIVEINLYNLGGERVAVLEGNLAAGTQALSWDCAAVAPGIYLARVLVAGEEFQKLKVAIVR